MPTDHRTEHDLKRALDALARAYMEGDDEQRARILATLDLKPSPDIAPEARIWIAREAEIIEALETRAVARRAEKITTPVSVQTCMEMLRCCAAWISPTSQRVRRTQAQLTQVMDWQSTRVSKALAELRAVGAVVGPFPSGYSQEWELDARYCSALTPEARQAACDAQQVARDDATKCAKDCPASPDGACPVCDEADARH
ncbi:MAG: hypothetical protein MUE79_06530 [Nitratireductor sp.]|nr:hypothetical protein [Nitratireductor sp.]